MKVRIILFLCSLSLSVSAQTTLQQLTGEWHFVAANEGQPDAQGIWHSDIDDFPFTATVSQDGTTLDCHADCLYRDKSGNEYAADWQIVMEQQGDQHRIGWVLTSDKPCYTTQYDGKNIYLLADYTDDYTGQTSLVGMTFWSDWSQQVADTYSLSNRDFMARTMYAVVSSSIPYAGGFSYIETWTSPKVQRTAYTTAIQTVVSEGQPTDNHYYNLRGQRVETPQRGLYIIGGRKVFIK